ncbi:Ig-like domain-containing protein, partial [Pseudomonas aeruginosa]
PIGQVTADGSGNWSFTPTTPLADGTVVNATATDAAGNTSGQASVTVDGVAPATPTVNLSNGSSLTGTAEPGSTVTLTDGNGNPIAEVTADGSGNWTYTPSTPIANGTVVNVVAQDAAGNNSPGASVTVDSQAPAAPVINPSNGITISGSAEPGSTVTLTDGNGNSIAQVTADGSGSWTFTPSTPLANGTVVNATATDPTGNTSAPASTTVDSQAPAAPLVDPSNGTTISGTAEPGASVTLTDGNGNPIGQVTADGSGNWSFTPTTPLADGTVVNATATDAAGNTSGQA